MNVEEVIPLYKLCKTEQSASRQRALEAGLLAAMGSRHYEEISVSDLCDQLQIPRKAFYRYFTGKDGALRALLDHTLMEYETYPISTPAEMRTTHTELERFFQFWITQKPLLDALQRSSLSGLLIERSINYALTDVFMPRRFLSREDREVQEQVTAFAVCGLMSMVLSWHHSGYPQPASHMAGLAVRLVSQPLFSNVRDFI
jgi:AcrR family transcriptional regulator